MIRAFIRRLLKGTEGTRFCACEPCTTRRTDTGTQAAAVAIQALTPHGAAARSFSHFVDTRPLHRSIAASRVRIISAQLGELDEEFRAAGSATERASLAAEADSLRHEVRQLRKEYDLC